METAVEQVCPSCGSKVLPDGEFCLFCGDLLAKSTAPNAALPALRRLSMARVTSADDPAEYAGFWLRVWAGAIDVVLEVTVALLLSLGVDYTIRWLGARLGITPERSGFISGFVFIGLLTVGAWLYCAFSESGPHRATIGKRMMGLQVVSCDGDRLNFGQASVRHIMKFFSLFTLLIGFMMAGWTKRRQALHDMPCDCRVIRAPEKRWSLLGS